MKKKSKKKPERIRKFVINKPSTAIVGVVGFFLLVAYIVFAWVKLDFNVSAESSKHIQLALAILDPALMILSMLISICFSAFFSAWLIDVKSKNSLFSDVMLKDICSSEEFYKLLSPDEQKNILSVLQTQVYSSTIQVEMMESVHEKLKKFSNNDLFFEKCAYEIECTIKDKFIEKTIIKRLTICSEKEANLENFLLVGISYKNDENFEIKPILAEVKLGDENALDSGLISESVKEQTEQLSLKNDYTEKYEARINKKIPVSQTQQVSLYVKYITRTPLSDKQYVCRLSHPCKAFSLRFNLTNEQKGKKYKLSASAFGFNDSASGSLTDIKNPLVVNVIFDSWAFPRDGVVISMLHDV